MTSTKRVSGGEREVRRQLHHLEMRQEAPHALLDDADALDRDAAATAELAAEADHLPAVGGGRGEPLVGSEGPDLGQRRGERLQGRQRGPVELGDRPERRAEAKGR